MKQAYIYTAFLAIIALSALSLSIKESKSVLEDVGYSERSVENYDQILFRAKESTRRANELEVSGGTNVTYKLALDEAAQLPGKLERLVAEFGLTLVSKNFDRTWSLTVSGDHISITKFCFRIETAFTDLRLIESRWTAQGDGNVTFVGNYEVWSVPQPGTTKPSKI